METRPYEIYFETPEDANDFVVQAPIPRGAIACYDVYNEDNVHRLIVEIPDERSAIDALWNYCKKAEGIYDYADI